MPVIATKLYYGKINGYTSGTVAWNLSFETTVAGTIPVINNTGLPAGTVGVEITNPSTGGGASGTATISATVNGVSVGNVLSAIIPAYANYGWVTVRNGYDGDVGIYGYVSESNPFYSPFEIVGMNYPQTNPDIATSYSLLTSAHDPDPYLTLGIGELGDAPGAVSPAAVGTNRNLTVPIDQFWQRSYYLPMRSSDSIWCTSTIFAGYAQAFIVTLVVGPDPYNGEQYVCSGSGTGYGIATIDLERLANVGVR